MITQNDIKRLEVNGGKLTRTPLQKIIAILAVLLSTIGAYAQGSLTLNAGDIYVYQFNTLLPQGSWDIQEPPGAPAGKIDGLCTFQSGSSLFVEMFEDTTNSLPIATQTLNFSNSSGGLPPPPGPALWSLDACQDLQGTVRGSMLSGSATFSQFQVAVIRNDLGALNVYSSSAMPVPEPNSILLGGFAALLSGLEKLRRSASIKNKCPY